MHIRRVDCLGDVAAVAGFFSTEECGFIRFIVWKIHSGCKVTTEQTCGVESEHDAVTVVPMRNDETGHGMMMGMERRTEIQEARKGRWVRSKQAAERGNEREGRGGTLRFWFRYVDGRVQRWL